LTVRSSTKISKRKRYNQFANFLYSGLDFDSNPDVKIIFWFTGTGLYCHNYSGLDLMSNPDKIRKNVSELSENCNQEFTEEQGFFNNQYFRPCHRYSQFHPYFPLCI
jgi:hypothetical protein